MIEKSSSATFLPCLHLIRGICAIGVACYHFSAWRYDFVVGSVGTFGVYTFFTLSAVVLLHRHQSDFSAGIDRSTLIAFYRLRIARVMPLLALVAIFGMVFVYFQQGAPFSYTWRKTFLTASGLMALHMPGIISTTTGAWSLGIELAFYAVFPMLVLLLNDAKPRALALITALFLVAQHALLRSLPASDTPEFWGEYIMPLTFAPFFAFGFLIYSLPRRSSARDLLLSLACLTTLFSFSLISSHNVFSPGAIYLLLTGLSVASVYFALNARIPTALSGASQFLGDISYALYLTHWIAYEFIRNRDVGLFAFPVFAAIAMTTAVLAWKFVEGPSRRWLTSARKSPNYAVASRNTSDSVLAGESTAARDSLNVSKN
ncbi:acyltransferase family protein [Rhizobium sp. RAF36]|uniref:acyltransferase family protein n=1 Tax=Rhizobium sp. RAF36 TaxID=3233055 RepID=UPI003F96A000